MSLVWTIAIWVNYTLAALVIIGVLLHRREPVAMIAWILAILLMPLAGMLLYWLLGSGRLMRKVHRRRKRVAHLLDRLRARSAEHVQPIDDQPAGELPPTFMAIEQLARRLADMPATGRNDVVLYTDGQSAYGALVDAVRSSKRHVHVELYILGADATGASFREELIACAKRGVECRLLLDAVGCWTLGRAFTQPLLDAGVQVSFFLPIRLFPLGKRWSIHLRNHRKLVIVDGETAFTGSANVGDEYLGRDPGLSPWFDAQIRVSGPAALFLQEVFAEDWFLATRERLDAPDYFPAPTKPGSSIVQILPTGPDQSVQVLAQILFAAVSAARESIQIVTPYFVPDAPLRMALEHAALRGLKVRLVLPTRSDAPVTLFAARSFYAELVDAGLEIYEYEKGMLHAKAVVVDDQWCLLGSANMDARSFRLNYEISAAVCDPAVVGGLTRLIDGFCEQARRITRRAAHQKTIWRRIAEGAARLLAPLL